MKRVLIIGTGDIGELHLRCFQKTGRVSLGICEINDNLCRRVADQYGIAHASVSLEEAMELPWDAAVIATPTHTHIPIALNLVRRGIHLLIEKPLSVSLEGVAKLVEQVRRKNVVIAVGYSFRAHPALAAMQAAIKTGHFGRPLQVVAIRGANVPFRRPAYRDIYAAERSTGGGAIQDVLTHLFNAGEWLVGPITRIAADAAHMALEGIEVEDTVHVLARHGDIMGCYSLNQYQMPAESTITVICQGGTARAELHNHRWLHMTEPDGTWHEEAFSIEDRDEQYIPQAEAYLDTLDGKRTPLCSLEEGIQTLRVNLAALASSDAGGRWEKI